MNDEPKLKLKHLRQLDYCTKGSARIAKMLGIEFALIRRGGIPIRLIEHVEDVAVQKLVAHVKEEYYGKQ